MYSHSMPRYPIFLFYLCVLSVTGFTRGSNFLTSHYSELSETAADDTTQSTVRDESVTAFPLIRQKALNVEVLPVSELYVADSELDVEVNKPESTSDPNKLPPTMLDSSVNEHLPEVRRLLQMETATGTERIEDCFEVLRIFGAVSTTDISPSDRHGRELKLFSLDADDLNLDIGGRLLDGRPKFFLETPDVAVGLEGLFSTLARTTLAGLANRQLAGGLNTGLAPAVPQMKGVQQQYQLQFNRGPWNIQSGLQVGVQAQDDPTGTFFLNPANQPPPVNSGDPQEVFQQASDLYYGQGFTEGYNQGFTTGTLTDNMGTPTSNLPPLGSSSPAGYNEGVVAGFTSGLQDGYHAGFQAGRVGSSRQQPQQQQAGFSNNYNRYPSDGRNIPNALPRALPHVSPGGPLPAHLYEAQAAALQAYQSNFQSQNLNKGGSYTVIDTSEFDKKEDSSNSKSSGSTALEEHPETSEDEAVDEELIEELRSKQARLLDQQAAEKESNFSLPSTKREKLNNQAAEITQSQTDDEQHLEEKTKIAGMDLMVAVIVFSGILFFIVLLCILCIGYTTSRKKSKDQTQVAKLPPLKSKVSDLAEISAYMKSPTLFDNYIQPRSDHHTSHVHRAAGAKE